MSTVTINGNTYNVSTMPTSPSAPVSIEVQHTEIVAKSTNPFTFQSQVYDWGVSYKELSVSYSDMTNANAQNWITFLESLKGPVNVFCFSSTLMVTYANELTVDGTNPRYFRLKGNPVKWTILPGGIYHSISLEISEVV